MCFTIARQSERSEDLAVLQEGTAFALALEQSQPSFAQSRRLAVDNVHAGGPALRWADEAGTNAIDVELLKGFRSSHFNNEFRRERCLVRYCLLSLFSCFS